MSSDKIIYLVFEGNWETGFDPNFRTDIRAYWSFEKACDFVANQCCNDNDEKKKKLIVKLQEDMELSCEDDDVERPCLIMPIQLKK